jgi:hypothetical protein
MKIKSPPHTNSKIILPFLYNSQEYIQFSFSTCTLNLTSSFQTKVLDFHQVHANFAYGPFFGLFQSEETNGLCGAFILFTDLIRFLALDQKSLPLIS